ARLIRLRRGEAGLKGKDGKKGHPAQKPEALVARVLLSSSKPGDLVIDPFNGTGTTGAVAKRLGRSYIGFERDKTYAKAAEARIAKVEPLPEESLAPFMTAREAPRVAFSELIERGMIMPGTKLFDAKKKLGALVRADGAIMFGDKVGSIHRIGAVAQGAQACNGWTFWHVETKKGLKLIDELRAEIRAGMAADGADRDLVRGAKARSALPTSCPIDTKTWARHAIARLCPPCGTLNAAPAGTRFA